MQWIHWLILIAVAIPAEGLSASLASPPGETDFSQSPHARLKSIGMTDARWTAGFWADRVALADRTIVPQMWQTLQLKGNGAWFGNLRIAAGLDRGEFTGRNWSDGDVYKWLEGAALAYAGDKDPARLRLMDEVIAVIAKAQQPDGYISTDVQLTGKKRWREPRDHEMFNMGHLFTAAVTHSRATGKTNLLAVATRAADYVYGVFRESPIPWHTSARLPI